jgi:hypothetical protein
LNVTALGAKPASLGGACAVIIGGISTNLDDSGANLYCCMFYLLIFDRIGIQAEEKTDLAFTFNRNSSFTPNKHNYITKANCAQR